MAKGVAIGLTNLHYAFLDETLDVPNGASVSGSITGLYKDPIRLAGAITGNFSPSASNDTLFADDGPYEVASTLGAMTLELNVADIPPVHRAALLGEDTVDGIVVSNSDHTPPWVAVGMSVKKSNGSSRLIWYLKGKFSAPDENNQTKADSINWNTPTIQGNFTKRLCDNNWRYALDTDDIIAAAKTSGGTCKIAEDGKFGEWFKVGIICTTDTTDTNGAITTKAIENLKNALITAGTTDPGTDPGTDPDTP